MHKLSFSGWVTNIRNHKNQMFVDVLVSTDLFLLNKDLKQCFSSLGIKLTPGPVIIQVVDSDKRSYSRDDYICVLGLFKQKLSLRANSNFLDGFELHAESVKVLGKNSIQRYSSCADRFSEPYLSMRRSENIKNILLRSKFVSFIRKMAESRDYVELFTPLFTIQTPEGAREFTVHSSKFKDSHYALPQSPQLYKQMLMAGGIPKYYQIAPCFRDESSRKNRYPGEFYQFDYEMSFTEESTEYAFSTLVDTSVSFALKMIEFLQNEKISNCPIVTTTMSYSDAVLKYCTDKPDMRISYSRVYLNAEKTVSALKVSNGSVLDLNKIGPVVSKCKSIPNVFYIAGEKASSNVKKLIDVNNVSDRSEYVYIGVIGSSETIDKNISTLYQALLEADFFNIDRSKISFVLVNYFPLMINGKVSHNPFSLSVPDSSLSYQFDLVINGEEVCSGALRTRNKSDIDRCVEDIELFSGFVKALESGCPLHGGAAFGIDRFIASITGEEVSAYYPFPLNQSGHDLCLGAPILKLKQ